MWVAELWLGYIMQNNNKPYRYVEAEKDCDLSLNLDHTYIKAHYRRATARTKLSKIKEAIEGEVLATSNNYNIIAYTSWHTMHLYPLIHIFFRL